MSALLHQTLDDLAGQLIGHVIMGQPLSVCETRRLAAALQTASARARAIEGANVVPWPREKPTVRAVDEVLREALTDIARRPDVVRFSPGAMIEHAEKALSAADAPGPEAA